MRDRLGFHQKDPKHIPNHSLVPIQKAIARQQAKDSHSHEIEEIQKQSASKLREEARGSS
jgi:hypothetical protein